MLLRTIIALGLLASACGSTTTPEPTGPEAPAPASGQTVVIDNQGGDLEGHTPRGFAGTGTGLFAGDELNAGFPQGDGVQMWLTFELPASAATAPVSAVLESVVLQPRGTPFVDLGNLEAAPVTYAEFSPELFDLEPIGESVVCDRPNDSVLRCDATDAVTEAIEAGRGRVQFRVRFERLADDDGEADLARFFVTDTNTNEPGLFTLTLDY